MSTVLDCESKRLNMIKGRKSEPYNFKKTISNMKPAFISAYCTRYPSSRVSSLGGVQATSSVLLVLLRMRGLLGGKRSEER